MLRRRYFHFIKLRLDPAPGPEMKSTGEVFGSDDTADLAYLKLDLLLKFQLQVVEGAYLTVRDQDKKNLLDSANKLKELGFILYATPGTADYLQRKENTGRNCL